jgi:hypothetical protein
MPDLVIEVEAAEPPVSQMQIDFLRQPTFLREGAQVDTQDGKLDLKQERAELVRIRRRLAELELTRVEERTVDGIGSRLYPDPLRSGLAVFQSLSCVAGQSEYSANDGVS